jgi:hypothetical protein
VPLIIFDHVSQHHLALQSEAIAIKALFALCHSSNNHHP